MKEKDIIIKSDSKQIILYAEKENGIYGAVQTGPYMLSNFLDDYWEKVNRIEETGRQQMLAGDISPLDYWRRLRMMTIPDLASRVDLPQGQVKKHFQPKHFKKLSPAAIQRYTEVLGIPVEAFSSTTKEFTMNVLRQGKQ